MLRAVSVSRVVAVGTESSKVRGRRHTKLVLQQLTRALLHAYPDCVFRVVDVHRHEVPTAIGLDKADERLTFATLARSWKAELAAVGQSWRCRSKSKQPSRTSGHSSRTRCQSCPCGSACVEGRQRARQRTRRIPRDVATINGSSILMRQT